MFLNFNGMYLALTISNNCCLQKLHFTLISENYKPTLLHENLHRKHIITIYFILTVIINVTVGTTPHQSLLSSFQNEVFTVHTPCIIITVHNPV